MSALFAGLALIIAAPALKPPKDQPPPIVGLWIMTDYSQNGAPLNFTDGTSMEFRPDGKRLWREGGELDTIYERHYKLIPKSKLPAIDLIRCSGNPDVPDVFRSIYKIDGDTLIITIGNVDSDRPKKHGEGWRVMKYKRKKKE